MLSNIQRSTALLAGLLCVASSLAAPVQNNRSNPCAGIAGGVSTFPGASWQIHAVNTTGGPGVQIVLGADGATEGSSLYVLAAAGTSSINESSGSDFTPGTGFFNLSQGGISALTDGVEAPVLNEIDSGSPLGLVTTVFNPPGPPTPAWCALSAARGTPWLRSLAVYGNAALFSLCPDNVEGQTVVGYNMTGVLGCYAVNLFMVHSD